MRDITLDKEVLSYLARGETALPLCKVDRVRVLRWAEFLQLDAQGRLWTMRRQRMAKAGDPGEEATWTLPEYWEYQVEVPPIREREGLVERALVELCFPSGDRLYELLRGRFYWSGMYSDC